MDYSSRPAGYSYLVTVHFALYAACIMTLSEEKRMCTRVMSPLVAFCECSHELATLFS